MQEVADGKITEEQRLANIRERIGSPLSIRKELDVFVNIRDTLNELDSIERLFKVRREVIVNVQGLFRGHDLAHTGGDKSAESFGKFHAEFNIYHQWISKLRELAGETHHSISGLLDLKQKEANVSEARSANEQALAAQRQERTILIFTIITIIFLPLYFLTSRFGVNARELTGASSGISSLQVALYTGTVAAGIFSLCFLLAFNKVVRELLLETLNFLLLTLTTFWAMFVTSVGVRRGYKEIRAPTSRSRLEALPPQPRLAMLSAFTARPLVELKQRDRSKIESLLAYGNRLLVGLNTGCLRIYLVNEPIDEPKGQDGVSTSDERAESQSQPRPVDLLREEDKFSRRPIQQLAIIKEANILIALTDNHVSIYDLQTYALQEQLTKTKGVSTFAVTSDIIKDPVTEIPSIVSRLAVAAKRKILLWSWQDSELATQTVEMTLPASARSLTWATATKLVAGMDSGFVMVDTETQEIVDILAPGTVGGAPGQAGVRFGGAGVAGMSYMGIGSWAPKPLATRLTKTDLLLAKDINTLFIDSEGNPLERRQIPWSTAPEAIGYSYPYMLALHSNSKGTLEIRNPETLSLLQSVSVTNATHLHVPQPNVSLAHAGKGFLVASDRCIWRMCALDYDSQIDELVAKGQLDEAISLLNMLEEVLLKDKDGRLREIKMLKAQNLFDRRRFRDALDLFTEVSAPPERVIALYPNVIAGDLAVSEDNREDDIASDPDNTDGHTNGDSVDKVEESRPSIDEQRTLAARFKAATKSADSDTSSIRSSKRGLLNEDNDALSVKGKHTETLPIDRPLEGKELKDAVTELCSFLAQTRVQLQRYLNPDGTLKAPARAAQESQNGQSKAAFESLLVAPAPAAGDEDREQKLRETAKLVDTTLFRSYMLARPSLAGSLFRIPNFCDPDVVNEKLLENGRFNDLVDFFHGKKLHQQALELLKKFGQAEGEDEAAPGLHGPRRTVGYLQNLPPELIDLILSSAEWPLKDDPDLGMEIFLADTENAESLPRDRVIDFLQDLDSKLAVRYLEHIIYELNDLTPEYHQRLVNLYLERLKWSEDGQSNFEDDASRSDWRERTLSFLRASDNYSKVRVLSQLPRDDPDYYEARAIVLSKMGQHKQALEIYVFKLEDFAKAEEYCNYVHMSENLQNPETKGAEYVPIAGSEERKPSIYHTLLSLYLTPPQPHKPNWPPALDLLSKHGSRLPASSTLDIIPSTLPVKELEDYFRGQMRAANSVVNEGRVVTGLWKNQVVAAQAVLLLGDGRLGGNGGRNRKVIIDEERLCGACHKRLGGSVIEVLPDNSVIHLGCANRMQRTATGISPLRKTAWE
ncbi:MAG: hypothetical protein M1819_002131 [Sarea resinae]|nr:MAG: hypothetical protein M1819_002131 [Sarea resinae]